MSGNSPKNQRNSDAKNKRGAEKAAPRRTRSETTAATRDKLISAAAAEFASAGLSGARVQEITKRAGVALGTFYVHFKDKDELFDAVIARGGEFFANDLTGSVEAAQTPKERDIAAMERAAAYAEKFPDLFRILMTQSRQSQATRGALADLIADLRRLQYPPGKEDGLFWPDLPEEIAAIAETGLVFVVLDWWMDNKDRASREEIIAALVNLRRYGVERPPEAGPDFATLEDVRRLLGGRETTS